MRLGLLGPSGGNVQALEQGARLLLDDPTVERVVYLGVDGLLDQVVERWAIAVVGNDPSEAAVWTRAARSCLKATPDKIDAFIEAERERRRLRILEALPDAATRAVEMLGSALALMVYDKAELNEEDMLPARLLVFGRSKNWVVKQVGPRWFLSPGELPTAGVMTLSDRDEGVELTLFSSSGTELHRERLSTSRGMKLKVSAGG